MHHVGAADVHLRVAAIVEREDARVLEVAAEHTAHADGRTEIIHPRNQGAHSAHDDVDRHTRLAGAVEGVDDGLVDERVDLDADARRMSGAGVLGLGADELEQPAAQVAGRDEHALELLLDGIARELVEEPGEVFADLVVSREETEVFIDATRLGVVVARADVGVVLERAAFLLPHDERELAVRLETDEAVDDVHARLLELACPLDVVLLVEARLDLDESEHGLSRLGRVDQRLDDRAVAARAVERLLDGEHVGVARGLLEKGLHARRERLVGVVHEHVVTRDRREDVRLRSGFARLELHGSHRYVLGVLEVRPVDLADLEEAPEVERRRQPVDLLLGDAEFAHEETEREVIHVVGDLETDGRAETTPQQLALEGLDEVLGLVFFDLDVFIARDAELVVLENLHSRKKLHEVVADEVFECQEPHAAAAVVGQLHEARQHLRHL